MQRAGITAAAAVLLLAVGMAWFGPKNDETHYVQTTQSQPKRETTEDIPGVVNQAIAALFTSGERKRENERRNEASKRQQRVAIKYYAPQIVGAKGKVPKAMRSGSKLLGFLLNPIDTRSPAPVRVRVIQGGEAGGVEIEKGSVLTGQYSYGGSGDRVFVSFMRLDTPDGEPRKIHAHALDSGTYTAGISGRVHSDGGLKVAAQLGLTMFSGMADVLVEKESLGYSQDGVQAKPTMRNALLQGLSRSAQDQSSRTQADINSVKDYVVVPEGKEMIIELTEDYK